MAVLKGRPRIASRPLSPKPTALPPPPPSPPAIPAQQLPQPAGNPNGLQLLDASQDEQQQEYLLQWHTRVNSHAEASTSYTWATGHQQQQATDGSAWPRGSSMRGLPLRYPAISMQPAAETMGRSQQKHSSSSRSSRPPTTATAPSPQEVSGQQQLQWDRPKQDLPAEVSEVGAFTTITQKQQQSGTAAGWGSPVAAPPAPTHLTMQQGGSATTIATTTSSSSSSSSSMTAAAAEGLLRGPGSGFQDPRLEAALSRWVLEAPDWFTVRTLYLRWQTRLNVVHLAVMFHQLARLTNHQHRVMQPEERQAFELLCGQLARHVQQRAATLDGRTAVALLQSVALLVRHQAHPPHQASLVAVSRGLQEAVVEYLAPFLTSLDTKQLGSLVWSLGVLRGAPGDAWCQQLFQELQQRLPRLTGDNLAVIMYGLSGLQVVPPSRWVEAALSRAEQLLPALPPQQLSMLLVGLGRLQLKPRLSFMEALTSTLQDRLRELDPPVLTNTIWALAQMGYVPSRSWLGQFYSASSQLLETFTPGELSVSVWSLSQQQLQPTDTWLDEFFDQSESKWRSYSLRDLALTGYALARLGLRPPQSWLRRFCRAILRQDQQQLGQQLGQPPRQQQQLTPACVRQIMVALAAFKVPSLDSWRQELYAAAGLRLTKMPTYKKRVAQERRAAADAAAATRPRNNQAVQGQLKYIPLPLWQEAVSGSSSSSSSSGGGSGSVVDGRVGEASSSISNSSSSSSETSDHGTGGEDARFDEPGMSLGISSISSYEESPGSLAPAVAVQQQAAMEAAQAGQARNSAGSPGAAAQDAPRREQLLTQRPDNPGEPAAGGSMGNTQPWQGSSNTAAVEQVKQVAVATAYARQQQQQQQQQQPQQQGRQQQQQQQVLTVPHLGTTGAQMRLSESQQQLSTAATVGLL